MMKKISLALLLMFTLSVAYAQQKHHHKTPERFQMELEQYITRKAGLTQGEAARFFPFYSEMLRKLRTVHEKMKNLKKVKPKSDAECKKNIQQRDKLDIEMKEIQKAYHEKFTKILPASKVYDILKAEDRFHRQAFKRAADKARKDK